MTTMSSAQIVSSAATVMIGTAFLAVAAIGIATPARADSRADFAKTVNARIESTLQIPSSNAQAQGVATVAVIVAANGRVESATIARTSGTAAFDREALRTAKTVRYPATGKARTVAMVLGFNRAPDANDFAQGKGVVEAYRTDHRHLLATDTTAQPVG